MQRFKKYLVETGVLPTKHCRIYAATRRPNGAKPNGKFSCNEGTPLTQAATLRAEAIRKMEWVHLAVDTATEAVMRLHRCRRLINSSRAGGCYLPR